MKTLAEFCKAYRMSRRTYYRRLKYGQVPRGIRIGRKILIEEDTEADWLKAVRGVNKGIEDVGPI